MMHALHFVEDMKIRNTMKCRQQRPNQHLTLINELREDTWVIIAKEVGRRKKLKNGRQKAKWDEKEAANTS